LFEVVEVFLGVGEALEGPEGVEDLDKEVVLHR
jgi:hypothetical protein